MPCPHKFRVDGKKHRTAALRANAFLLSPSSFSSLSLPEPASMCVFPLPTGNSSSAPYRPPRLSREKDTGYFFLYSPHNAAHRAFEMEIAETGNCPVKVLRPRSRKCHGTELCGGRMGLCSSQHCASSPRNKS